MITLCEANLWKKNPYLAMLKNLFFSNSCNRTRRRITSKI